MPRLDASLTQGLMNPTYSDRLAQAGGMLGGMGGQMRQTRQDKEKAQKMAGMTTEGLLSAQREAAATPAEAIAAGLAQEKFGRETEDRQFTVGERTREGRERAGRVSLSGKGKRYDILVREGKTEEAQKLFDEMEKIAIEAGVPVGEFVSELPEKKDDPSRYLNIGGGKVFDTKTATMIGGGEGPEGLDANDLAQRIYQNKEAYTEESWEAYSKALATDGVFKAAKELEGVDVSREAEAISAAVVADSSRNIRVIDDLLDTDVNEYIQAGFWWIPASEAKSIDNAVDTLKANVAFDRLQKMRDNSKTGGALGQVSEKELRLLEANLASLDPTSADFKKNLRTIRRTYERIVDIETGPQGFDEEGRSKGSPNFFKADNGVVFWADPETDIVYDYATGAPI